MTESKCNISIEAIIHKSLRTTINKIASEHGLYIKYVGVDWSFDSIGSSQIVDNLNISTETTKEGA